MTTLTFEVQPMTAEQIRQTREEAVIQTLRKLDKPSSVPAIVEAMPEIPIQAVPGYATIRKANYETVRFTLLRLMARKRVRRIEVRTNGLAYLYEAAA